MRWLLAVVCVAWCGTTAAACPAFGNKDKHQYFTARQLAAPKVSQVRAGGTVLLDQCEALPGSGNIPFDPNASIFYVADARNMALEFRTEGPCDTVLLIRTPSGGWHFDDDDGADRNARIRFGSPHQGRYEIWVGSQGGGACAARVAVQTFRSSVRLAGAPAPPGRL